MKNSESRFTREIIKRFHSGRFPQKVVMNFHLWLLSSDESETKDETMNEVWLDSPYSVKRSTYRSLDRVLFRLGMAQLRKRPAGSKSFGRIASRVAAVLLPVALLIGTYFILSNNPSHVEWARLEVPNGETGYRMLADGTEVWLNAGSSLEYPVKFAGRQRDVKLYGEGFFSVAENARKPFTVHTEHMTTKVVGTEFNISCYDNQLNESVTVLDGRVDVTTGDDRRVHSLDPDSQLTYWEDGRTNVEEVDASALIRWRESGLMFEDSTFEDILSALERKYDLTIEVDSIHLTDARYRMQFVNNESLEYILDVIHSVVGLPYRLDRDVLWVGNDVEGTQSTAIINRRLQENRTRR